MYPTEKLMELNKKKEASLIVQTAFLGDCILSFPLLEKAYADAPERELLFLCRKGFGSFIKSCFPYVTPIEVQKSSSKSYKSVLLQIKENYSLDTIYCVHRSFRSLIFTLKLNAKTKIHFTNSYRKWLVNGPLKDSKLPEAVRILQQYGYKNPSFGEKISTWAQEQNLKSPKTHVPQHFKTHLSPSAQKPFDLPDKYIVLAPGSVWETKKWPAQKFAGVAKLIKDELNLAVIVLGSQADEHLGLSIKRLSPHVINLIGQTSLPDCKDIVSNSLGFIGNDSGLVHMAALFDIPSVAVFGPTHENLGFKPWQNYGTISSLNLSCSPCGTHGAKKCPIGTHDCMKDLDTNLVFSDLKKMLNKKSAVKNQELPDLSKNPATL